MAARGRPTTPLAGLTLSPEGDHAAYVAGDAGKYRVVLDGVAGPPHDDVAINSVLAVTKGDRGLVSVWESGLVFSADGRHLAYVARDGDKWLVVTDGTPGPGYEEIGSKYAVSSPDNKHLDRSATTDARPMSESPVFSPDGTHLAYAACRGGKWFVVRDGVPGEEYDNVARLAFSPDGEHLAFKACQGSKWFVVRDQAAGAGYDEIFGAPLFGPDGTHLAYAACKGQKWLVVVDEVPEPAYEGIMVPGPLFGRDGQHVAYIARDGGKYFAVVDGEPGPAYEGILGEFTGFGDEGAIEYLGRKSNDRALYRVRHAPTGQ